MKILLTSALLLVITASGTKPATPDNPAFTCTLTSDKTIYKLGEVPKLEVRIINNTKKAVYLIGSLDGSASGRRMPACYFNIEKPHPDTVHFFGCGVTNSIRPADFQQVKPAQQFDPYQTKDDYGYFTDYVATQPATYRQPGTYKIQFHYSTAANNLHEFVGTSWSRNYDSLQLKDMLSRIPKIELVSNEIEIKVER
ncbi:MAG: hypothetical protein QM731_01880 [Chitinophagaceae bacterium]